MVSSARHALAVAAKTEALFLSRAIQFEHDAASSQSADGGVGIAGTTLALPDTWAEEAVSHEAEMALTLATPSVLDDDMVPIETATEPADTDGPVDVALIIATPPTVLAPRAPRDDGDGLSGATMLTDVEGVESDPPPPADAGPSAHSDDESASDSTDTHLLTDLVPEPEPDEDGIVSVAPDTRDGVDTAFLADTVANVGPVANIGAISDEIQDAPPVAPSSEEHSPSTEDNVAAMPLDHAEGENDGPVNTLPSELAVDLEAGNDDVHDDAASPPPQATTAPAISPPRPCQQLEEVDLLQHCAHVGQAIAEAARACQLLNQTARGPAKRSTPMTSTDLHRRYLAATPYSGGMVSATASQGGDGGAAVEATGARPPSRSSLTALYEDEETDDVQLVVVVDGDQSAPPGAAPKDESRPAPLTANHASWHAQPRPQGVGAPRSERANLPRRTTAGADAASTQQDHQSLDAKLHRRHTDTPAARARHGALPPWGGADEGGERSAGATRVGRSTGPQSAMDQLLSGTGAVHGGVDTPFSSVRVEEPRMHKSANIFTTHTTYLCVGLKASGETLRAERRYTDFLALQTCLRKQYPALREVLPALPEKKILGKFKSTFVERRRVGLEAFLLATCETQPSYRFISRFLHRFFAEAVEP
jgi:hypothetical protein